MVLYNTSPTVSKNKEICKTYDLKKSLEKDKKYLDKETVVCYNNKSHLSRG